MNTKHHLWLTSANVLGLQSYLAHITEKYSSCRPLTIEYQLWGTAKSITFGLIYRVSNRIVIWQCHWSFYQYMEVLSGLKRPRLFGKTLISLTITSRRSKNWHITMVLSPSKPPHGVFPRICKRTFGAFFWWINFHVLPFAFCQRTITKFVARKKKYLNSSIITQICI